jgi:hypothetical protein
MAWAHRPVLSDGSARDASTALYISDVDLSQVVYNEVTAESPQLWLAFDLQEGQSLYFQLGVPVIDRLRDYRPALALIGPGLPQASLPFVVPDGLGAQEFTSAQITEPTDYYEPFSGTAVFDASNASTVKRTMGSERITSSLEHTGTRS